MSEIKIWRNSTNMKSHNGVQTHVISLLDVFVTAFRWTQRSYFAQISMWIFKFLPEILTGGFWYHLHNTKGRRKENRDISLFVCIGEKLSTSGFNSSSLNSFLCPSDIYHKSNIERNRKCLMQCAYVDMWTGSCHVTHDFI